MKSTNTPRNYHRVSVWFIVDRFLHTNLTNDVRVISHNANANIYFVPHQQTSCIVHISNRVRGRHCNKNNTIFVATDFVPKSLKIVLEFLADLSNVVRTTKSLYFYSRNMCAVLSAITKEKKVCRYINVFFVLNKFSTHKYDVQLVFTSRDHAECCSWCFMYTARFGMKIQRRRVLRCIFFRVD